MQTSDNADLYLRANAAHFVALAAMTHGERVAEIVEVMEAAFPDEMADAVRRLEACKTSEAERRARLSVVSRERAEARARVAAALQRNREHWTPARIAEALAEALAAAAAVRVPDGGPCVWLSRPDWGEPDHWHGRSPRAARCAALTECLDTWEQCAREGEIEPGETALEAIRPVLDGGPILLSGDPDRVAAFLLHLDRAAW